MQNSSMYLGIDPDLHSTAIAIVDAQGKPVSVRIARVKSEFKEREAVVEMAAAIAAQLHHLRHYRIWFSAVEGQEIVYSAKRGANPRDMLWIASVAGAAIAAVQNAFPKTMVWFPSPSGWKGSVEKHVHQSRVIRQLGWNPQMSNTVRKYSFPTNPQCDGAAALGKVDWSHATDAFGLALFAREQVLKEDRRDRATAIVAAMKEKPGVTS